MIAEGYFNRTGICVGLYRQTCTLPTNKGRCQNKDERAVNIKICVCAGKFCDTVDCTTSFDNLITPMHPTPPPPVDAIISPLLSIHCRSTRFINIHIEVLYPSIYLSLSFMPCCRPEDCTTFTQLSYHSYTGPPF